MRLPAVDNQAVVPVLTDDGHNAADGGAGIDCKSVIFFATVQIGCYRCCYRIDGHTVCMIGQPQHEGSGNGSSVCFCPVLNWGVQAKATDGAKASVGVTAKCSCHARKATAKARKNTIFSAVAPLVHLDHEPAEGSE